jgi:hypothetical protein
MNIIVNGPKPKSKILTVADMKPGMVYRVWEPFDASKPDNDEGQLCLKLSDSGEILILATRSSAGARNLYRALTDRTCYCGHPNVRVAEVYGQLTGVEVRPISEEK